MARDMLLAAIELLKRDADVAALADTRVYGEEVPESEAAAMPRPLVVLSSVPIGGDAGGYIELEELAFDALCYGETPAKAAELRRAVYAALKHARRQVVDETLLHWFKPLSGPRPSRVDTQWPYCAQTWQALVSEKQAT